MLSKYTPSQKAKATAALLSALVLFLTSFAGYVAEILPTGNGAAVAIGGGVAIACAWLVRMATFLTNSAPTLDQIAKHTDDAIELVQKVAPEAIDATYVGRHRRSTD
ncbi:holin [Mycobacterium phage Mercurio]|uniref:Holin n=1 Tax=Mycobacterium phage Mercurio TaxID=2575612 RepID=A0A5J6T6M9_9CAUD|nr:holin [Mycobacterium phage Mercurio]QFG06033.1 holin [Mycobacterium phage Mercurio]